ncbi:MAG: twin-arginine translocation signal domain-containing protein [Chloroflexi bacterium]|nr:twin-arginine translocation signal domain-containing protein [Chloroflexota bacterium]
MERRSFLKVIAAGGAAAVNFLYPGLTGVVSAATQADESIEKHPEKHPEDPAKHPEKHPEIDPDFAGGFVVERTAEGFVLAAGNEFRAIRLPKDASVWKEFENVDHSEIQIGDYVDVRGTSLADGSLLAKSAWANIGRLDGTVEQLMPQGGDIMAQGSRVRVAAIKGGHREIELSSALEVVRISDADADVMAASIMNVVPGTKMGAVGLRLPNGGFRATKIWIWPQA